MTFSMLRLGRFALLIALTPAAFGTTWYVNGVNGNDGNNCLSPTTACKTIGHAMSLAAAGDILRVASAIYTENLSIGKSLTITGAGATTTIIDGSGINTVVAIPNANTQVGLSNLTIRNGTAKSGGGINNSGTLTATNCVISGNKAAGKPGRGGGIYNTGVLTINRSTLKGNVASGRSCLFNCAEAAGAGIDNERKLVVNNSTLSGNSAQSERSYGGGIFNPGTASINNSTLSGNNAVSIGGGIESPEGSMLTINNSTLSGNIANAGGAISSYLSPVTLQNTIVANNTGGDCNGAMTSYGYNLSSDSTCSFNSAGDMNNTNPILGPLQNNGGPTQTMPLLSGSPAIDAGNPSGCTDGQGHLLTKDQRGMPRPDKEDTGGCDIGAYEKQSD